ncbi:hypothetical protein M7I_6407 [Glarea lozoyensis 74030]|uniref:Uncharacterized protein n=1 Tax=Glarea lozoyensis (strain ATCC 74030 / MF5533) TaxID=1104152 RepID=H0EUI1_GLAL7|nr:hypothetical protein M7I_6407 [Glarea lozoyensis 74030]
MLGREEAESEMRRYREETRALRRQVDEGRAREIKVGERLETVMESYGRAKETFAHTQAVWEKEIRRARKEAFKSQSAMVKVQEELKATRNSLRMVESDFDREKERSLQREQEAFAARYQLVGVQEEVGQLQEQIKLVEQERDGLRMIAKNEEVARIAAEGRLPLPKAPEDDEFASPKKARRSLDPVTVISSAASEEELEDMQMRLATKHGIHTGRRRLPNNIAWPRRVTLALTVEEFRSPVRNTIVPEADTRFGTTYSRTTRSRNQNLRKDTIM